MDAFLRLCPCHRMMHDYLILVPSFHKIIITHGKETSVSVIKVLYIELLSKKQKKIAWG